MRNKHLTLYLAVGILTLLLSPVMLGQGDLPSEEIEVVKAFNARIIEARKVAFQPEAVPMDTTGRSYVYNVSAEVPPIEYVEPSIKPLALQTVRIPDNYDGFARVGYGMPNAWLGDLQYEFIRNEDMHIGVDLSHTSANNKDIANQRFMDNDADLWGTWYASELIAVKGNVGYSFDDYYYYAEDPNEPNPDFNKRRYKTFRASTGAFNSEIINERFSYSGDLSFINHQDDQGVGENDIRIDLDGSMRVGTSHELSVELVADFTSLSDVEKQTLNNYGVKPVFTFRHEKFKVKGGVLVANGASDWYFFPEFEASMQLFGETLTAFVGANGGLYKNNFYNLSTYNPYITDKLDDIRNTRNTSFYGGASGKYQFIEYEARYSYTISKDLALFLPDNDRDARTFLPIYDDVNISTISATVRAEPIAKLETGLIVSKNFYSTTNEEEAWHLPGFEGRVFASYRMLDDRLRLRADFFTLSGLHYIRDDKSVDNLKGIYDLSFGADWFFTDQIGVFANVNNVFSNKAERWQRYPSFGFNALGGLIVRF